MIPCVEAQQLASKTVATVPDVSTFPAGETINKIVSGISLEEADIERLRNFWDLTGMKDQHWQLAYNLYGGDYLKEQYINLEPTKNTATITAVDSNGNEITLIDLGPSEAITSVETLTIDSVMDQISKTDPIETFVRTQTITATLDGYWTLNNVWDSKRLNEIKNDLETCLTEQKVFWDNNKCLTAQQQLGKHLKTPEIVTAVDAKQETVIVKLKSTVAGVETFYNLKPVEGITASDKPVTLTGDPFTQWVYLLLEQAKQVDQRFLTQIETAINSSITTALNKVGLQISKTTGEFRDLPADLVAIRAEKPDTLIGNSTTIDQLIKGPLADVETATSRLFIDYLQAHVLNAAQDLNITVNIADELAKNVGVKAAELRQQVETVLKWRLDNSSEVDEWVPPTSLTRDFINNISGNSNSYMNPFSLITASLVTVAALKWGKKKTDPTQLSSSLIGRNILVTRNDRWAGWSKPIADIMLNPDIKPVIEYEYVWRGNYFGTIKTKHYPDHKKRFGLRTRKPEEEPIRPGDHRYCKCGWEPKPRIIF